MEKGKSLTYRDAGVDIEATDNAKEVIKTIARGAQGPEVLTGIGSFGGLFKPVLTGIDNPVLVGSADGVGTKVMIAKSAGNYRHLGCDLVNHCVNDIGVMGAMPLFFLDYIAFGVFSADVLVDIIAGIAKACKENGCSLLGGETAEMPDLYRRGDFDMAGFIVGMVDQTAIIDGSSIVDGDVLIGVWSDGLHTNGYSLVRKVFFSASTDRLAETFPSLGMPLAEALLRPHLSYLPLFTSLRNLQIKGMAHITGGGIAGNLRRILPHDCRAIVQSSAWDIPPLFKLIESEGSIERAEMWRVFNMGIGLIIVVSADQKDEVLRLVRSHGPGGAVIGSVVSGQREVSIV